MEKYHFKWHKRSFVSNIYHNWIYYSYKLCKQQFLNSKLLTHSRYAAIPVSEKNLPKCTPLRRYKMNANFQTALTFNRDIVIILWSTCAGWFLAFSMFWFNECLCLYTFWVVNTMQYLSVSHAFSMLFRFLVWSRYL